MSNLLEHAKTELKLAGYNLNRLGFDYGDSCAKNAYAMLKVFSKAGHSGFSANATLSLFNKLAKFGNLTELTNDPSEWNDIGECCNQPDGLFFQSKRNSECFSNDGLKTYYKLSDGQVEVEPGWVTQDKSKYVYYPLKSKEENEKHSNK